MNKRNWLDLSRKLVDRFDMDYSFSAINSFLGLQALSYFGEGVLPTKLYPNPFPISLNNGNMGGSVGDGVAYDPNGQLTEIPSSTSTPTTFTIAAGDPSNPRWDLLVLRYVQTPQVLIPKPSDPIINVYLNLVDDFQLAVIEGTPSGSPVYPSKGSLDIILCGFKVPVGATVATQVTVDLTVRDIASSLQVYAPLFKQERPSGAINGVNTIFTLSLNPLNANSILVMVDDLVLNDTQWSFSGPNQINLAVAPNFAQDVYVYYAVNDPQSVNPLTGFQEVPGGTPNGVNTTFTLSGKPANQQSTMVFVNGKAVESQGWNLIQGSQSAIQFNSGYIPQVAQSIYVFYFVNAGFTGANTGPVQGAANLGSGVNVQGLFAGESAGILDFYSLAPGTNVNFSLASNVLTINATGGGGGSSREVHGSAASPISINPSVGVVPTNASNQVWWITPSSGSGNVPITATPPISTGGRNSSTGVGDVLCLKSVAASNYLSIPSVSGVDQNGTVDMGPYAQSVQYTWDGTNWSQDFSRV